MSSPADLSKLRINRDAPAAPVRKALGRNLIIFVVAIAVIAAAILALKMRAVPTVQVITAAATGTTGSASGGATSVTANGYVVARTKASVSAKIAGRLAYLGVSEGSFVHRGDIIARLDNADLLAAVSQARANVSSAEASVIETAADKEQLAREAARVRDIRASNPALLAPQDYESATSRSAQADARYSAATARKQSAEAALQLAEATNDNTVIRAPFTGTVLRKDAEVGEVVAPSVGGGLTRGAVVTMADLATLEVEVDVNEAYIGRITSGQAARITLDAYPDTAFRGVTRQVVPTADRQRATVQVKVTITDHDPRILPEMGAKVDFLLPDSAHTDKSAALVRQTIRVPEAAVKTDSGATVVWVVREGRLVRRVVTTGPVSGGYFEIRSGLNGGEQLLVGGVESPANGMRVKVP
ncbi:MAG TPA: efflux RND transporter periplasmic adaptor subunit [Gemmatimonadaceae bacterium]|jgi:RND family efflux transporter MFP subunit|nr:efflux RND transporter periplasmic adaptor subunit [Gemmatimonadaceae bacterium]